MSSTYVNGYNPPGGWRAPAPKQPKKRRRAKGLSLAEAQELHEAVGAAVETGDLSALPRARELAAILVSDLLPRCDKE